MTLSDHTSSKPELNLGENMSVPLEAIIGKCIGILGIRGSGKTNTAAVIVEEVLRHHVPLTIVDIDGEYWGLKEQFEILHIGTGEQVDIRVGPEHGTALGQQALRLGVPVILDVSGLLGEEQFAFLLDYFKALWEEAGDRRAPYYVVLEEAHEFIPQGLKTDLKEILIRIALRGRKRGLGLITVSQRSAKVEKDVLTQAEVLFLHKVVHPTDLRVYRDILPWSPADVEATATELRAGEAIFYWGSESRRVKLRKRSTFHAGYTPSLEPLTPPALKEVSAEIIEAMAAATQEKKAESSELARLRQQVDRLKAQIAERDSLVERLETELETVSRIRVQLELPKTGLPEALGYPAASHAPEGTGEVQRNTELAKPTVLELPSPVKNHFDRIKKKIGDFNNVQRKVLELLVSRAPSTYTYSELASWTSYSESTLYKNDLPHLVRLGLVDRSRVGQAYRFRSALRRFVENEFAIYKPEIDDDTVSHLLELLTYHICG